MTHNAKLLHQRSLWTRVMEEGQLTRDPVLRTKTEIDRDETLARELEKRRRELFPDPAAKKPHTS